MRNPTTRSTFRRAKNRRAKALKTVNYGSAKGEAEGLTIGKKAEEKKEPSATS